MKERIMRNGMTSHYRRRGSAYLAVIGASLLLATIGFSTLTLARIRSREINNANNWTEANHLAFSAVEYGISQINRTPGWRSTLTSGDMALQQNFGGGTIGITLIDEEDGDIASGLIGPMRLYGIGRAQDATRVHSVLIGPEYGLDVLRMGIHAGTELYVKTGDEALTNNAPASSNGNVRNDGIIYGDTKSATTSGGGVTTGTTTTTAPRQMPDASIFNWYIQHATEIPYTGHLVGRVLGPNHNPWGTPNEDGLYYIDTVGNDLEIEGCRILGTLVIKATGKKLRLKDADFIQNYRSDYPALIVEGELELKLKSESLDLSEAAYGVNLNPAAAPYGEDSDTDMTDTYPNEIHGLIHARGPAFCFETTRIRGMLLCEDKITVENTVHVIHDSSLYDDPPLGYGDPTSPMITVPGTWRWDAIPDIGSM